MSENTNNWMNVSCDVPGYENMTALAYAKNLHDCISRGQLALGLYYLEIARDAKVLYRMELAIQEFKNANKTDSLNTSNNVQDASQESLAQDN